MRDILTATSIWTKIINIYNNQWTVSKSTELPLHTSLQVDFQVF